MNSLKAGLKITPLADSFKKTCLCEGERGLTLLRYKSGGDFYLPGLNIPYVQRVYYQSTVIICFDFNTKRITQTI
uniref:Uncharacterized protein n=1 Tax=Trichobilharzia regenti TaxID=157069 RepID=A0AA85KEG4_TRIRE|nr:unnamed protein product [Trichobilharzia regenti]CAH8841874.1 unnamed protein product [Trichobilharzia regenti]